MENEIWKPVPDYEMYEVSDQGRIRKWLKTSKTWKPINSTTYKNAPYKMFTVCRHRKPTKLYLHRILAQLFLPNDNPDLNPDVCFKDGNIANTTLSNLYWSNQDARMKRRLAEGKYENVSHNCKLTKLDVMTIRWMKHHKVMSYKELAKYYGVHPWTIYACVKGITWKGVE
jgi:hypothetical protein